VSLGCHLCFQKPAHFCLPFTINTTIFQVTIFWVVTLWPQHESSPPWTWRWR